MKEKTITRWISYVVLSALIWFFVVRVEAQQPEKVPRIGFLTNDSASDWATALRLDAFRQGLRELGYVEGKNIIVEHRYAEGKSERLIELAEDLARLKVDIFVVPNDLTARAAKKATPAIPIVMASSGNPIGTGVIASLARPGGNVTGLTSYSPELLGKRLELLKEAFLMSRALHFLMMRAVRSAPPELPLRTPKSPRRFWACSCNR